MVWGAACKVACKVVCKVAWVAATIVCIMVIATDGEGTKDYIIENSTVTVVTISHRRLRGLFFVNCIFRCIQRVLKFILFLLYKKYTNLRFIFRSYLLDLVINLIVRGLGLATAKTADVVCNVVRLPL